MTSLVFLVVLTLVVLAVVRGGSLEERMARNARDRQAAIESAEAVLRDAETAMFVGPPFDPYDPSKFTADCVKGLCRGDVWKNVDWSDADHTLSFNADASKLADVTTQPRYVVEIITPPIKTSSVSQCQPGIAQVTAHGVGNGGATALVQSTVRFKVYSNICD
jgi:type IV pilus assembly protein PilX